MNNRTAGKTRIFIVTILLIVFYFPQAFALKMPNVFGDHMVLQHGVQVPVWGWAKPGVRVTVKFMGQVKSTVAATTSGRWDIKLDPLAISLKPANLTVIAEDTIIFKDVLVGEVWLCSGQSNMQKPLGAWRGQPITTLNADQEIAQANYPLMRLMNIKISEKETPADDVDTTKREKQDYPWKGWVVCSSESIDEIKFSAAGYYFGRSLFKDLKVPIGLIEATAGGSSVEAWTPESGFATDTALAEFVQAAKTPKITYKGTRITTLYNGMIHPIIPYAIKGILWYQGESNLLKNDGPIYANKFTALITSWRVQWGSNLPFYFVQLPPLLYSARVNQVHLPDAEPNFREYQMAVLKLPNTGMVVTTDIGDLHNMHPPRKKEVGERLALIALNKTYGKKDIEYSGPIFKSLATEKEKLVLHFEHVGKGLVSQNGESLTWFSTAGEDGVYYPAKALIYKNTVIISCEQVPHPEKVRFAWDEKADSNFFNKDGLPAVPFRTDQQHK